MNRFASIAATGLALAMLAAPAAAAKSPLEGRWKNGKMEIVIAPCGPSLCGTIVKASERQKMKAERGSDTDLIGARLITDIRSSGSSRYSARVFLADRNRHAKGTIHQVSANRLEVKGCLLGLVCKSADWDRIR